MERTYPIALTSAAEDVILRGEGAAPPSSAVRLCPDCGARGEVLAQVEASDDEHVLHVVAPCEHIVSLLVDGGPAYLVWGGLPGYSVLPLAAASWLGWQFAQAERGVIHILGRTNEGVIGLLVADEAEWLELTSPQHLPCGQEPAVGNVLEFVRRRLRIAPFDDNVAVFKPLNLPSSE
jgi:hypothetical protein